VDTAAMTRAETVIRAALAAGDSKLAFTESVHELRARLADERKHRPEVALADAELAGTLLAIALRVRAHEPPRPPGCPAKPRPHDLLAVFQGALDAGTADPSGEEA
jgi:hypothetical protein